MQIIYGVFPEWDHPLALFTRESDARRLADKLNAMRGEKYYDVDTHVVDPTWEEFIEAHPTCTQEEFDRRRERELEMTRRLESGGPQ